MIPAYLSPLADHLWQSTCFVVVVWTLTLLLKRNQAHVRYWLWLAASIKFLVPFAPFVALGGQFRWETAPFVVQPDVTYVVETLSQPFSGAQLTNLSSPPAASPFAAVPWLMFTIWLAGSSLHLLAWWVRWRRVAAVARAALPVESGREVETLRRLEGIVGTRPIRVLSSDVGLEPAVFGVWRPVLLWPQSFSDRLGDGQLQAILAHELCHVRRRDNLAAAVHMLVEAIFWFHPIVWWMETRLVDERERACDEEVIRLGTEPQAYAEGILRTCELYAESPIACMAGVTGSDLKRRIETIMRGHGGEQLNAWRKIVVMTAAIVTVIGPISVGAMKSVRGQAPKADARPSFGAASVKPNKSGQRGTSLGFQPSGRFRAVNEPLWRLIAEAYRTTYQLRRFEIIGVPGSMADDRFDVEAVPEGSPTLAERQLMLQQLLADRFKLRAHRDTRDLPTYNLVKARSDGRLGERLRPSNIDCAALRTAGALPVQVPQGQSRPCVMMFGESLLRAAGMTITDLADMGLSRYVERKVVDQTGLKGGFEWSLEWGSESAPADLRGVSVFTALQEQLGLKLESARGPLEVIVIDSVDEPTDDAAQVDSPAPATRADARPPSEGNSVTANGLALRTEQGNLEKALADGAEKSRQRASRQQSSAPSSPIFEVASIKPNKSGSNRTSLDLQPSGRFIAINAGLPGLISVAYGDGRPLPGNRLSISPDAQWIRQRSNTFDIEAKATGELTRSQLPFALRTLLAERFKLVVHYEPRELPIYAMVLARTDGRLGPRLRRSDVDCSDPANTPPASADGTPACGFRSFPGKATGRVTMADLAQRMFINALEDRRLVEDRTGLAGTFEFDLEWTPDRPPPPRPADAPPAPPIDPNGASIFTALEEQLGLELKPAKDRIEILVVDSVEHPTPD